MVWRYRLQLLFSAKVKVFMIEQRAECVIDRIHTHELTQKQDGINLTALLQEKQQLIMSSRSEVPGSLVDIHLSDFRIDGAKPPVEKKHDHADDGGKLESYSLPTSTFSNDVYIEAAICANGDAPTVLVEVAQQTFETALVRSARESPHLLERFFTLLKWEAGMRDPKELRKILPLLHQLHVSFKAELLNQVDAIVGHPHDEAMLQELLTLSRKVEILDGRPERFDTQYIENPRAYDADYAAYLQKKMRALLGVTGVSVDGIMLYPNAQGIIEFPLQSSTFTYYADADSIERRELATFRITQLPDHSLVLWYESGLETGTAEKDKGMVYAYEKSLRTEVVQKEEKARTREQDLVARLTAHYAALYKDGKIPERHHIERTQIQKDRFLVGRDQLR